MPPLARLRRSAVRVGVEGVAIGVRVNVRQGADASKPGTAGTDAGLTLAVLMQAVVPERARRERRRSGADVNAATVMSVVDLDGDVAERRCAAVIVNAAAVHGSVVVGNATPLNIQRSTVVDAASPAGGGPIADELGVAEQGQ